jgi:hypothetical protein
MSSLTCRLPPRSFVLAAVAAINLWTLSAWSAERSGKVMWMRGGILVVNRDGSDVAVPVDDPVQVEPLRENQLRLVTGDGKTLEGRLPTKDELQALGARNVFPAVGLFAQREAELLLAQDGPSAGRVLDGAFVPVSGTFGGLAKVALPWVNRATTKADPSELARRGELEWNADPFWVRLDDLGLDRHSLAPVDRNEVWVARQWRVLRTAPERESPVFAVVFCMPARLAETRKLGELAVQRVDYRFEGVIVSGWVEKPFPDNNYDHRCTRMMVRTDSSVTDTETASASADRPAVRAEGDLHPAGLLTAESFPEQDDLPSAIADAFKPGRIFFVPVMKALRLECAAYRVATQRRKFVRRFVRLTPPAADIVHFEYGLGLQSNGVDISGPDIVHRSGQSTLAACMHRLRFVRLSSDRLEMVSTHDIPLAFHPDDVEVWYRSEATCKAQATSLQVSTACR